jgi:hypothetical protein
MRSPLGDRATLRIRFDSGMSVYQDHRSIRKRLLPRSVGSSPSIFLSRLYRGSIVKPEQLVAKKFTLPWSPSDYASCHKERRNVCNNLSRPRAQALSVDS